MTERITDERLARMIEMAAADTVIFAERKNRSAANYFKDVESALRELASLREQTRWRPMEEAPKDGAHVLAFSRTGNASYGLSAPRSTNTKPAYPARKRNGGRGWR